jgi:uncharacterized protein YjiS (DUF1127 family)
LYLLLYQDFTDNTPTGIGPEKLAIKSGVHEMTTLLIKQHLDSAVVVQWIENSIQDITHLFWNCYRRSQQRQALSALEPELLSDIGLSVEQMQFETVKPFWKS